MAKFVIECPHCGRFTEASTGFFARRKINCTCGNVIHVKTDKMASKICPKCGNHVVYDQSKGDNAKCPVCSAEINTIEHKAQLAEFTCPSCSCKLSADKYATNYTCPLCDTLINVQERIEKEKIKNQGLASVIKYEGNNDTFVWKHPIEDFNLGSQLIVHESQEAIFFRDGKALDLFGPGRYTLSTQSIPLLESLYKLPTNTNEVFHSEVYFINLTTQMGIKWGTDSKVRFFDPGSGLHIEIGACGNFSLRVTDSRKLLIKLVGTTSEFTQVDVNGDWQTVTAIVGKFKALIMNKVKANLAKAIKENNINILEIDEHIDTLSETLRVVINETLDEYGLVMPEFYITSVLTPDDDANFKRLKQQFAEKTLKVREEEIKKAELEAAKDRLILEAETKAQVRMVDAQSEAQLKMVDAQGEAEALRIKAQAEADAYRAQAEAEAMEMKMKGYTYAQETSRMVGMEAMQNGITGGSVGGGGSPIGDIAGLGVALGAMGGVVNMTKDVLNPIMQTNSDIGAGVVPAVDMGGWTCTCGKGGITSKFCPECGSSKPEEKSAWNCACGKTGITSNFCPECGAKKPENTTWNCACGKTDITSKFCPECGAKKLENTTWDCPGCGNKGINAKFCPECGHKKED